MEIDKTLLESIENWEGEYIYDHIICMFFLHKKEFYIQNIILFKTLIALLSKQLDSTHHKDKTFKNSKERIKREVDFNDDEIKQYLKYANKLNHTEIEIDKDCAEKISINILVWINDLLIER